MELLRLTNSELSSWSHDKRMWYLGYYRGLKSRSEKVAGKATTIGTLYHDAMAAYYDPAQRIHPAATVEAISAAKLEAHPEQEKEILKEKDLVLAMVEGYLQWIAEEGADSDLVILAAETKIEVELVPGINLLSKLDARVQLEHSGERMALEHKTVGSLTDPLTLLQLDSQLLTEHLVEFLKLKEQGLEEQRARGVLYNMARKVKRTAAAKPPFYGREEVHHNDHELRNHWYHVVAKGREIQAARARLDAGESHHKVCPPTVTRESTWRNSFLQVYGLMNDGSDWEAALAALYEPCDPLERYWGVTEYEEA